MKRSDVWLVEVVAIPFFYGSHCYFELRGQEVFDDICPTSCNPIFLWESLLQVQGIYTIQGFSLRCNPIFLWESLLQHTLKPTEIQGVKPLICLHPHFLP